MSAVYPAALSSLLAGDLQLTRPEALGMMLLTDGAVYDGNQATLGDFMAAGPPPIVGDILAPVTVASTGEGALTLEPVVFPGLAGPVVRAAVTVYAPVDVTSPEGLRLVCWSDRINRLPMAIVPDGSDLTLTFQPLFRI